MQHGILLIDKEEGFSSHDVVNVVRGITDERKVGHAGTLDPMATGLLILLVGKRFTKRQDQFMKQDKNYEVTARLGWTSDTFDRTGEMTQQVEGPVNVTRAEIEEQLKQFRGEIDQTVPIYSAIKQSGRSLYTLARQGKEVTPPTRKVTIYAAEVIDLGYDEDGYLEVRLRVACSTGTYIRSLVSDLGKALGVGAVVTQLRRITIGEFHVDNASELHYLTKLKTEQKPLPFVLDL
jgi:tRNA pseudouridine55 synthase